MNLAGLSQINVELSARCDAACSWCGHQNRKINPAIEQAGDMDFQLLAHIASQLPPGIVAQMHRDGEALMYPLLGPALRVLGDAGCIRSIVTNGIRLAEKAEGIIENCETVCVSVADGLAHADDQRRSFEAFVEEKGDRLPRTVAKFVGEVDEVVCDWWWARADSVIRRRLHAPQRNTRYRGGAPEGWEHGLCTDLLSHPSIDWRGDLFLCNRLDPTGVRRLGSLREKSLAELWNGPERAAVIRAHIEGRAESVPQCVGCEYRGLPAV